MTYEYLNDTVSKIVEACEYDDDPKAHQLEDQLREEFLRYLEQHFFETKQQELFEKTKRVLSTSDLDFARWVE